MKFTIRQLAQTALLFAICMISQYFRQFGQHITGSLINAAIILAVLAIGLRSSLFIAIATPITSFLIHPSPVISAVPLLFPTIMLGNLSLAACVWFFQKKLSFPHHLPVGLLIGSLIKSAFLGICTVFFLLPVFGGSLPPQAIEAAKIAFSLTQLITALTGSLLSFLIWIPLKKYPAH